MTVVPEEVGRELTLYDVVDRLFGSRIGLTLNELLIKGCMDFFDEGQSVWRMPGRKQGLFRAWSHIAKRNRRLRMRGLDVGAILARADDPESMIHHVMTRLQIPERLWMDYFALELAKLHGWAGFVRWRSQAHHYYWQQRNPADLVDFVAIRLVLSLALIEDAARRIKRDFRYASLVAFVERFPHECLLRCELNAGTILPDYAHRVEVALDSASQPRIESLSLEYRLEKTSRESRTRAARIRELYERAGVSTAQLRAHPPARLRRLIDAVHEFKAGEGMVWTRALEHTYMQRLLARMAQRTGASRAGRAPSRPDTPAAPATMRAAEPANRPGNPPDTAVPDIEMPADAVAGVGGGPSAGDDAARGEPKVQTLFCIDVRSERLRRQMEALGNYETFGIAGFFGVPVAFIELGKGHETALCPAIVTPKNVALEMPHKHEQHRHSLFHLAHEVVHDLKSTVLAPYVTVEAVGLLFGFDMVGKTLAPRAYNTWRRKLDSRKPPAALMIDKITKDDALELVANLQEEMIVRAVEQHFGIKREAITNAMIRELREIALGERHGRSELAKRFDVDAAAEALFISSLQIEYRVNPDQAKLQLEHLAKLGFRIKKQAFLIGTALRSIGLTEDFGRIVLVVGHGSSSENNPYESALDCGACGGDHGLVNARIFAAMANRREVRTLLAEQGIAIPDETWFVPALHDTTTDEVTLYDLEQLPPGPLTRLDRISEDLRAAGRLCARERCRELAEPGITSAEQAARRVKRNALDWTQVRPEWGLSKNACFIIGGRRLSEDLDLDGRAFLHSYDYRLDEKGYLLENILSGPLVVGQWINMEHYFSTVDNENFGSGSKVYHNIVGRFGVMTGNVSDLRTGLPAQTMLQGERPYHQPLRLITLIEASFDHVMHVLERLYKVRELVENGWIRLLILDPETDRVSLYEAGGWQTLPFAPDPAAGQKPPDSTLERKVSV
ncbi:MAG: Na-translocating system protein MpsB [Thiohalocapsa sp.]|nr:Na-translocating system protein MpsB [Thiohalocapsa sp.]